MEKESCVIIYLYTATIMQVLKIKAALTWRWGWGGGYGEGVRLGECELSGVKSSCIRIRRKTTESFSRNRTPILRSHYLFPCVLVEVGFDSL